VPVLAVFEGEGLVATSRRRCGGRWGLVYPAVVVKQVLEQPD